MVSGPSSKVTLADTGVSRVLPWGETKTPPKHPMCLACPPQTISHANVWGSNLRCLGEGPEHKPMSRSDS